ncbi:TNFAIP3-interacting protein 1-like [Actinia tenebrosa]|uniref:TNFAIP3-interacting protein 1-like n=1 Tax=Actinia tenebrosa TaxID=6105 RepID=A0A6P8HIE2_ACTTE|nr:TNFAIP3-interacting protein 1-like [Actinia tenebrosa]
MMASSNVKARCSKCDEIQRLYLAVLEDKQAILVRLQEEQERVKKLSKEIEPTERKRRQEGERTRTEESTNISMAMAVNRKWKEEYEQLREKYKTDFRKLQEEISSLNHKLEESNIHVLTLEAENMRLAQALSGEDVSTGTKRNNEENELIKAQMQAYKDDFSFERRDREKAQSEKESIQEELKSAQEIIATLVKEIEVFKVEHKKDQEQMRQIINQQNLARPQLQIIYPVVDPSEHEQHTQWRRQQQRRGILSRGSHIAPPSAFYGGDVEVDQADGPKSEHN